MIHLVVASGSDEAIEAVRTRVRRTREGWLQLGRGVWFMGSDHDPIALRDVLGRYGAEILVIQVRARWASRGLQRVADWLHDQRDVF